MESHILNSYTYDQLWNNIIPLDDIYLVKNTHVLIPYILAHANISLTPIREDLPYITVPREVVNEKMREIYTRRQLTT